MRCILKEDESGKVDWVTKMKCLFNMLSLSTLNLGRQWRSFDLYVRFISRAAINDCVKTS